MTDPKGSNRIPFEDIDASTTAWAFPAWENGAKIVSSVKKKPVPPANHNSARVEEVTNHSLEPITAQQLQEIQEAAEREGREQGFKSGYEQGFTEGEKKGLKLGEQKAYKEVKQNLDDQCERFRLLADALLDPVAMQDRQLENTILDMAVHFAKHLMNQELSTDPTSLFNIVQRAAASLPAGAQNIRIYLHADDVELAHEAFSNSGKDWTFYTDPKMSRGGCRIESSHSLIDYSIEKRLQDMLEQVNFQGDIDSESLPPIGDYYREEIVVPEPLDPVIDEFSDDDHFDESIDMDGDFATGNISDSNPSTLESLQSVSPPPLFDSSENSHE